MLRLEIQIEVLEAGSDPEVFAQRVMRAGIDFEEATTVLIKFDHECRHQELCSPYRRKLPINRCADMGQ